MLIALGGSLRTKLKEVTPPHLLALMAEHTERMSVLTVKRRKRADRGVESWEDGQI